jgi:predicted glycosyltransferase
MKIVIYLNHPAHFHLFKNVWQGLEDNGHKIIILCKKKDILDELLKAHGVKYLNVLSHGRGDSRFSMILSIVKRGIRLINIIRKEKPDLIIGTAFELAHIGKLLKIPFISVNEDDAAMIPLWSKYSYPWASLILSPISCDNSEWNNKSVKYDSYHELAYLHPNNFKPQRRIVEKHLGDKVKDFVIIRFAKLNAHHDKGISGIDTDLAQKIISIAEVHCDVYITSERELEPQFEKYRININPLDIHHILAFAKLYIGDSQTMAAEAAVLGTPSVRFNDFVGKLGYLEELEHKYGLTKGIKTSEPDILLETVKCYFSESNLKDIFSKRKEKMLADKIDLASFLVWFIENYPKSIKMMDSNLSNKSNFK